MTRESVFDRQHPGVIALDVKPQWLPDGFGYVLEQITGKSVLNVGAAGNVYRFFPGHETAWPHNQISKVAASAVGLDIDKDAVEFCARHGHTLTLGDCETATLDRKFDAAVMMNVIEHVEAPGRCIINIMRNLNPDGKFYLSTANPTYIGDLLRTARNRGLSVYWDHQTLFAPEHIKGICDRHGFTVEKVFYYTLPDDQSSANRIKSKLTLAATRVMPRLAQSFLVVISKRN